MMRSAIFWTAIASLGGAFLSLAFNAALTRLLAPEAAGWIFAFLSLGLLLAHFVQFGLGTTAMRFISARLGAGETDAAKAVARKIVYAVWLSAIVVAVALLIAASLGFSILPDQAGPGIWLAYICLALYVISFGVRQVVSGIDRALLANKRATIAGVLLAPMLQLFVLLAWSLSQGGVSILEALVIIVAAQLAATMAAQILTSWAVSGPRIRTQRYREIFTAGSAFLTNAVVYAAFAQLGVLYLIWYGTPNDLAIYGLASRLMILIAVPAMMLLQYTMPLMTRAVAAGRREDAARISQVSAFLTAAPMLLALVVFVPFGETLLGWVFGSFYEQSYLSLAILLGGSTVSYFVGFGGRTVELVGQKRLAVLPGLIALTIAIAGFYLLFPTYGVVGIASSIAFAMVVMRSVGWAMAMRTLNMNTFGLVAPAQIKAMLSK